MRRCKTNITEKILNMKLQVKQNAQTLNEKSLIQRIFPEFGTAALDIPYYDSDKHMYLVDQYTSKEGNRSITYVAVSSHLCVEVSIGFYHSWTHMNKIRIMTPNHRLLKVVRTYEWPQSTYYDNVELCQKIRELAQQIAQDNQHGVTNEDKQLVRAYVDSLVDALLSGNVASLDNGGTRAVLEAYCRQMKVCRDFVAFEDSLVDFQI